MAVVQAAYFSEPCLKDVIRGEQRVQSFLFPSMNLSVLLELETTSYHPIPSPTIETSPACTLWGVRTPEDFIFYKAEGLS
jgi:hypothetical protein